MLSVLISVVGIAVFRTSASLGNQENQKTKLAKGEKRRQKVRRTQFVDPVWDWVKDDVPYIIRLEEVAAFKKLTTNDERQAFIENFWERRNPNPVSPENEYKRKYYQRIVLANENFTCAIPGWKTDRGRIYIVYGAPKDVVVHPGGGRSSRPASEGGSIFAQTFEEWHYAHIDDIGDNVILDFVDTNLNGEFRLALDPAFKDVMLLPHMHNSIVEPGDENPVWTGKGGSKIFHLDLYVEAFQPPPVKFKDLKAVITSKLSVHLVPFEVLSDFIRVTNLTVLTPITIQIANSDFQFQNKNGVMQGAVDVYGEIENLSGRIVSTFEKSVEVDVPEREFEEYGHRMTIIPETLFLNPGRYKVSLVLRDELSGHMGSKSIEIDVPGFSEDLLSHSSLILADRLQPFPITCGEDRPFVIGGREVRPSVGHTFTRDQELGIWMQIYHLGIDDKTRKPSLNVRYEIEKDGKVVTDIPEEDANLRAASQQFTAARNIPLFGLAPGEYTARIRVTDNVTKQSISPSTTFELH